MAVPAAAAGLLFAILANRLMPIPMRNIGNEPEPKPLEDAELPPLWLVCGPSSAARCVDFRQLGVFNYDARSRRAARRGCTPLRASVPWSAMPIWHCSCRPSSPF